MRTILFFCINLLFGLTVYGQYQTTCNYQVAVPTGNGQCMTGDWTLVFEEEFDGSQIDNNKWYTYFGYGDRCHLDEPQVYLDGNVTVNNGIASLLFKEQPGNYGTCGGTTKWRQYSSGMLYSKTSYLYGIFEAEIKIPNGTGFWPAFWLWGAGGEIDAFEFYDDESSPDFSVHNWVNGDKRCTYTYNGSDYSTNYHTYTVYWDPYFVAWFIDGNLKQLHWLWYTILGQEGITCSNLKAYHEYILSKSFPSHQDKEYIILNLAGQVNHNPTPLPQELAVKYVRAWQLQENVCDDKTISSFTSNEIKGKSVTVDGNITVTSGQSVTITAGNEIILKPGLEIQSGAQFIAQINPNLCNQPTLKSANVLSQPKVNFAQIDSLEKVSKSNLIENNANSILIYPNPVVDKLKVFAGKKGIVSIIDAAGNSVYNCEINDDMNIIDMTTFKQGFYIVQLIVDDKVYTEKIIKN